MLPPVLEIYVVWHPSDTAGGQIAQEIFTHFHGNAFVGLFADAVEVYQRAHSWAGPAGAPRPVYTPGRRPPRGLAQAELTVIVPLAGLHLSRAVADHTDPWHQYLVELVGECERHPRRVALMPLELEPGAIAGELARLINRFQRVDKSGRRAGSLEPDATRRGRELTQAIIRFASDLSADKTLTVFVSHTERTVSADAAAVQGLIDDVRTVLRRSQLNEFFSQSNIAPGDDWAETLRKQAASDVMLALRTDQYAGREWCQREMVIAKRAGQPVVILDSLETVEERGSFVMDHVPRVPVRRQDQGWDHDAILRGLNLLIDEALKRVLWRHQERLAATDPSLAVWWWAPHLPEPLTFARQLLEDPTRPGRTLILHPEPPLGPDEIEVLEDIATLAGVTPPPTFVTPRQLDARDGSAPGVGDLLPVDAVAGVRMGLSVSGSEDLARLGLIEDHFRLAVAELARALVSGGGELIFGGNFRPDSYTELLNDQLRRSFTMDVLKTPRLHVVLSWPQHRQMSTAALEAVDRAMWLSGTLVCLDVDGNEIDWRAGRMDDPVTESPAALSNMRRYMTEHQHARVFIGGRRHGYTGRQPGVIEEALFALRRRQPIYLAGGFGGATLDIVRALGIDDGSWAPGVRKDRLPGFAELEELAAEPGWTGLNNGLTADENAALAVSHRPSDIAGLVASGLGRLRLLQTNRDA
jgi:hypothetical protein